MNIAWNMQDFEKRKQKWEEWSKRYKISALREATAILTVKNTLALLKDKKEGKVLDIGCGFGEIDILLAKNSNFEIIGCDISEIAVKSAQNNVLQAGLSDRIKIEEGDVYKLNYPDASFDIALSFGYVSAATYQGVQKEVSRILKPEGILICDFINCLSFYKIFNTLKKFVKFNRIPYFITLSKIKREFEKYGLVFEAQKFFNTYPPLDLEIDSKIFLIFEDTVGRIFRNFLGRVRLVRFKKLKK